MPIDYAKYAELENYLFGEVARNFHKRGYLTLEEFFCIVIWKANRSKTKIKKLLLKKGNDLCKTIKEITSQIWGTNNKESKLKYLLYDVKFRLPMASAILTVLYPDTYSIYDVRVREQLKMKEFDGRKDQVDKYFLEFLPKVKQIAPKKNLREIDKHLWGKSFYYDLKELCK